MTADAVSQVAEASLAPRDGADPRIAQELCRAAYAGDRRAIVVMVLASLFVALVLNQEGAPRAIWIWCVGCIALAGWRWLLVRVDQSGRPAPDPLHRRSRWLWMLALAAGAWGSGPALFMSRDLGSETLFTGVWLAVAGLSAPLVAAARPAVYVALLPALGPLLVTLALHGSPIALLLTLLAGIFLLVSVRLALEQNDGMALGLMARFRNEDLVQQLRTQVDVAGRANAEKTRFLASAAHDLRQPLRALGIFCAALDERVQSVPEKPLVRNMMEAIEALEGSFGAMLDISRLDAGVVQKTPQAFPIRDLFRRLDQQFGGDAEAHELSLRFRAARRVVVSDPQLLERVLANLVRNALGCTRKGGVLVAARRRHLHVALEVWDTGVGIPDDKVEMIYRELHQVDNPERDRRHGLGMGLAIVQRLCDLLGHELQVHSRPGGGSVFRVLVPAGDRVDIESPPLETDTRPPRRVASARVLLIDDERAIRDATRELLRPLQVEVLVAATTAEAVAAARQSSEPIDLILSDWRLRGSENGIDAVRAVRAVCGASTPAVLMTGDTSPDLLKRVHESGLVILHKPLQPSELVRLVERVTR